MKRALLAFLSLAGLTAVALGSFQEIALFDVGLEAPKIRANRFGRRPLQVADASALEGIWPSYLVPTEEPELCFGGSCCQADDYASKWRLQALNATVTDAAGQSYSTFHMRLIKREYCSAETDAAGCCNADVRKIWVDVDPTLKVLFASVDGSPAIAQPSQSDEGFSLTLAEPISSVSNEGVLVTVTVAGSSDTLCALSDLAPIKGFCNVIVEGGSDVFPAACCPYSLSLPAPSDGGGMTEPPSVQCVEDNRLAGFALTLQSVTLPYGSQGAERYANYTFLLNAAEDSSCAEAGPNSCCGMDLNAFTIDAASDVYVASVELRSTPLPFSMGEDGTLSVRHLAVLQSHVPPEGMPLIVTVRLSSKQTSVPSLCPAASKTSLGQCTYTLRSTSGFCCPAGSTDGVVAGEDVRSPPAAQPPNPPGWIASPPPPSVLAQPPPGDLSPSPSPGTGPSPSPGTGGTCAPSLEVPVSEASLGLQYYEGPNRIASGTGFVFMLSGHNSATCDRRVCQDVCGWTLFVDPGVVNSLSVVSEDVSATVDNLISVSPGANASITFSVGALSEGTMLFTLIAPRHGLPLKSLCRRNALPQQGDKECAAVVRGPDAYVVAFFDQGDVIIQADEFPGLDDVCKEPKPLGEGCSDVGKATYNSGGGVPSVFNFHLADRPNERPGCISTSGGNFVVLLTESVAKQISVLDTSPQASFFTKSGGSSGVNWTWVPAGALKQHGFQLGGTHSPSDVCAQGVSEDQAPGTCVVAFYNGADCFSGSVAVRLDSDLTWEAVRSTNIEGGGGGDSSGATIGVAVGVTLGVVLLAALLFFFIVAARRKKRDRSEAAASAARNNLQNWDSFDNLAAPLNASTGGGGSQTSRTSNG